MELIRIDDLNISTDKRHLLEIHQLSIQSNQKIGLIGQNGVGKTTLINAICGTLDSQIMITGEIRRNCKIIMVPQILVPDEKSGGEREKIALEEAFVKLKNEKNSILVLDEPTSNLDISHQKWLIKSLKKIKHPLLVISHDRAFLNQIVDTIWHFRDEKIRIFNGNYNQYSTLLQKEKEKAMQVYNDQKGQIKKLESIERITRQKAVRATKKRKNLSWSEWKLRDSGSVEKRIYRTCKQLNKKIDKKIEMLDKPRISKPITLKNARSLGLEVDKNSSLLRIAPQEIKIFGRKLFTINQEIKVQNGTKWLISGKNGCGKSVFLEQVIDNTIQVWKHPKLKIGYFSQCIVTESKDNRKVIDDILKTSIYDNTTTMQLIGDLHLRKVMNNSVATLSGGETIYYKLAKILLGKHNLLILDEPTNYLDIDAIQALENFLIEYPFSVIIVSHDQAFIKKSKFEIWKIKNKQFLPITEIKKESRNSELEILEFQLRQKFLNPEIPLSEINELKDKIQVISD